MSSKEFKPLIYYFIRRKWHDQLLKYCDEIISKKGKDPNAIYWKAYALGMTGNISECIHQLESFSSRRDMQYPVSVAMLYFLKKAPVIDHDTIDSLNAELGAAEDVTKDAGMVLAARFTFAVGNFVESLRIIGIVLKNCSGSSWGTPSTPHELEAVCIDNWIAIELLNHDNLDYSSRDKLELLDDTIKGRVEQIDVDMLMCWAISKLQFKQTAEALNIYNQIIAIHPLYIPALSEKTMLLASLGEWEQSLDTAQRVLDNEVDNIDALIVIAVHSLTQESQLHDAAQKVDDVDNAFNTKEPHSSHGIMEAAMLLASICSRHNSILAVCVRMLERAQKNRSGSSNIESELYCGLGNICIMQGSGHYEKAMKMFRDASRKDSESIPALEGMILCQLLEGLNDDAEGQIELITVMHNVEDLSYSFTFLQALLARQGHKDMKLHLTLIDECRHQVTSVPTNYIQGSSLISFPELRNISPDFLMLLAVEYLHHMENTVPVSYSGLGNKSILSSLSGGGSSIASCGTGNENVAEISVAMQSGMDLLNRIIRKCPGMVTVYIETSRCYLALGKNEEALRCLHEAITYQPHFSGALVNIAKIELNRQNTTAADRALEQALSSDFAVRSAPLFRLIQVCVRAQQGRLDEAITEIELVMALPELRVGGSGSNDGGNFHMDPLRITDDDRVAAFVTHASLLSNTRRLKEANKVLSEAKVIFAGLSQEVQVLVAASQLAVERNDFDTAIRNLDKIDENSPTFIRAQMIKAEILLVNNHDKKGFIQCYNYLIDKDPSAINYALLGESYLRILNPECAVEALETAYKLDPSYARVRGRIGRALIATHEYHRAIDFYEQAIRDVTKLNGTMTFGQGSARSNELITLSHDLSKLYVKLGRSEHAIRVLNRIIHGDNTTDISELREDVKSLMMLYQVQHDARSEETLSILNKAKDIQKNIVNQIRAGATSVPSSSEVVEAEKNIYSNICEQLGVCLIQYSKDSRTAEAMFNESIQQNPLNVKAMMGLAKLFKSKGDFTQAQHHCKKIILANPNDQDATTMLSEMLFNGEEPESAIQPLQDLLKAYPNNYRALEKFITLLRRSGRLEEVPPVLKAAKNNDRRSSNHAGFNFCQGLYAQYTNDVGQAIVDFNLARKDESWGPDALTHMIELYLNPNQDGVWEDKDSGPIDDTAAAQISAAEILLKELQPKCKDVMRFKVLQNYWLLATRQKSNIDTAMQSFIEMLEKDQDYLPAVLGMATGFMVEKNQHKARNLLKRVAKMEINQHDGDDFGKANLLLAKFFVDKSMYDQAQDLCKRCLSQDKSSSQAWEILGLIMEKEGDHDRAAECYEKAWKLEFEASASTGFKLAFSYLKSKKFIEAIDICEAVLLQYPDYPRIKDEILKKAQNSIRC